MEDMTLIAVIVGAIIIYLLLSVGRGKSVRGPSGNPDDPKNLWAGGTDAGTHSDGHLSNDAGHDQGENSG